MLSEVIYKLFLSVFASNGKLVILHNEVAVLFVKEINVKNAASLFHCLEEMLLGENFEFHRDLLLILSQHLANVLLVRGSCARDLTNRLYAKSFRIKYNNF
jgi:hypothetical protein